MGSIHGGRGSIVEWRCVLCVMGNLKDPIRVGFSRIRLLIEKMNAAEGHAQINN